MLPEPHDQFNSRRPLPADILPPLGRPLPDADDRGRTELRIGWAAAIGFFGLFLGWAAFAPLDAAAHADGSITVSGNRQVVQHRDGGTVSALRVREGQHVRRGEVLISLSPAELDSAERALTTQVFDLEAQQARLQAEASGIADIAAPAGFAGLGDADRTLADAALARQRTELAARRHALGAQKAVLSRQGAEIREKLRGIGNQVAASRDQSRLYDDELKGMRDLLARGYASANRVRALERAQSELGASTSGLVAGAAAAREQVGETQLQSASLDAERLREVAEARRQVQASLTDLLPKLAAARAQLDRTRIRATASGQVVGLTVSTVGAVVQPAQTLMEIVPDRARLVVTANVSPTDADDLHVGQTAEIRLTAIHDRTMPELNGTITRLSADSFQDEKSGRRFYTAEVVVPEATLARVRRERGTSALLRPGMPVEMLVPLRRRTLLQYLLEPFDRALWSAMREH